jgi:hypothetical protein
MKETKKKKPIKKKVQIEEPKDHGMNRLLQTIDKLNNKIGTLESNIEKQKSLEMENRQRIDEADIGGKGYTSMYDLFMYNNKMFEKIINKVQSHYVITIILLVSFLLLSAVFNTLGIGVF